MNIEYEATFFDIDVEKIKNKLKEMGAKIFLPETLMKVTNFKLPSEISHQEGYVRVRDECYRKTMALKMYIGDGIESEKESEIEINDIEKGVEFLKNLGLVEKAVQEKKREIWKVDNVEIMFDTYPFLETYIEIEGKSELDVKNLVTKLGLILEEAHFGGSVAKLVSDKYGINENDVNNKIPRIVFWEENPFEKYLRENR